MAKWEKTPNSKHNFINRTSILGVFTNNNNKRTF